MKAACGGLRENSKYMEDSAEIVEHFFGVYLLYCTNPKYAGRTYIGYTVDPNRRIKQHNAGKKFGGAWKTSNKGPWTMVVVIHGFPNDISALRFEWAWQHPHISRRLKHLPKKRPSQRRLHFFLKVLSEMLRIGPWCRLPLTIRWLAPEFAKDVFIDNPPPLHMPICYTKVICRKIKTKSKGKENAGVAGETEEGPLSVCFICDKLVDPESKLTCVKTGCLLVAHLICMADEFSKDGMILPVEGTCPSCRVNVLWGDLIRKKVGVRTILREDSSSESDFSDNNDD